MTFPHKSPHKVEFIDVNVKWGGENHLTTIAKRPYSPTPCAALAFPALSTGFGRLTRTTLMIDFVFHLADPISRFPPFPPFHGARQRKTTTHRQHHYISARKRKKKRTSCGKSRHPWVSSTSRVSLVTWLCVYRVGEPPTHTRDTAPQDVAFQDYFLFCFWSWGGFDCRLSSSTDRPI